jgi:multiple sugar transport system permease protein
MKKTTFSKIRLAEERTAYLFLSPILLGFLVFMVFPIVFSIVISFFDWNIVSGPRGRGFIGLENYIKVFQDRYFISSLKNTIYFTVVSVPLGMVLALIFAIQLNKNVYFRGAMRTFIFMPYVSNLIAVSIIFMALYSKNGPINMVLMALGVKDPPMWLASSKWAMSAIILMDIWRLFGFKTVIYLAALQAIPRELYESAEECGANGWQRIRYITISMLSPTTFFLLVTGIINAFKIFGEIWVMTDGGPGTSTYTMVYNIFKKAFIYHEAGFAAAITWIFIAMIFIITLIQWKGQKKWVHY